MASREKRVSRPPLRFVQDEYWEHGRRRDQRPVRQVYRLLKQTDVREDLAGHEVHVYWPEDQQWYRASVEEVTVEHPKGPSAYLHYPDTDEYEDVNLNELIGSSQIAVIENKSFYAKLKRDEIPVNAADRMNVVYEDEAGSGDAADDDDYAGEIDDSGDSGGDDEQQAARESLKETQRIKRPRESGQERSGNAKRTASTNSGGDEGVPRHHPQLHHPNGNGNAVHSTPGGGRRPPGAAAVTPGEPLADNDMAEAEAFKNSLMSALMHTFSGPPSTMIPTPGAGMIPTPGPAGSGGTAASAHTPMIMIPTPGGAHAGETSGSGRGAAGGSTRSERQGGLRSQNSLPTAGSAGNDDEVRSKVREQLASALQRARDELKAEGYTEALPDPIAVAADVETELYKLHDNSVSKDYKAKFRSLSFNLRDNANPELRARVLRGELPPSKLVTLGPAELARKELSEWRQKRQEEAAKMVFLDAETAAKFSTAAAAALAQSRIKRKEEETPAAKPTASPERAAAAAASPELPPHARIAGDGAAAAAAATSSLGFPLLGATTGGDASAAAAAAAAVAASAPALELGRRTSVQGMGTGAEGAPDGAGLPAPLTTLPLGPASTLSPTKRTVLRAALPAAAAAAAGDETPPRADQDGDAPYDPDSYDDAYDPETQHQGEDNLPKYNPFGSSASTKPSAAPSIASLRAGPSSAAPAASGPPDRQTSLPSPIRSPPAAATGAASASASASALVADLSPVIQRQMPGEGPLPDLPLDNVGDTLWQGVMRVPGQPSDNLMVIEAVYLGGSGRLGLMLRCSEPPSELLVKGQVKLGRVEQFFEDLRRSRSRTISLALVRQLSSEAAAAAGLADSAAAAARCAGMAEFVAQHRTRTGLATPQAQLEAYLVTRGPLAARLLKTARVACPAQQMGMLPEDIDEDQLLLAMVHPRIWEAPPHVPIAPAPPHHHHHQQQQPPQPEPQPQHAHKQQQEPAAAFPTAEIDFNSLTAAAAAMGLLQPPPAAAATIDPRLRGSSGQEGAPLVQPPPAVAAAQPSDAGGGLALDVGALNELAAVLGLAGGAGGKAAPPPEVNPQPTMVVEAPGGGAASTQLVTMVMQNPDGTLAIVAVPQGAPPPTASPPTVPAVPPQPQAVLLPPPGPLQVPIAMPGPVPGHPPPPPQGPQHPPHPHQEHPPQYLPPGTAPPPGPGGPYGEPPPPHVHEHYPGGHGHPPPPGRYGGPPPPPPPGGPAQGPPGGPPPPPYVDPRGGPPPPPHHGFNPPPHTQDPYYAGQPPPHHHHHNYQPPPPGHGGNEPGPQPPYGPPRDGPEGRPPPYYPPPREIHDGRGPAGFDDPYYHRGGGGGPPGPHDGPYPPYHGGAPGRGGPPRGEWAGEHGRWGGRRGGGSGGRGRGPPEEGRGGYGYEGYGDRGGRPHDSGGYRGRGRGGGGGRDHGDWAGGERREWEGGRGGEWGFRERGRGPYGRPDIHHHR